MRWITASILVALMLVAGCGSAGDRTGTEGSPTTAVSTTQARGAFDFSAETLDGGNLDGASLKGKDVILWFWAPWCPTCLVEGRSQVAQAIAELPDGVEFIGVAGRSDDLDEMRAFLDWTGTGDVTHVADTDGSIWAGFQVVLQPAFYFVNQDGTYDRAGSGLTTEDILAQADELLSR